jgi:hypothetical protein
MIRFHDVVNHMNRSHLINLSSVTIVTYRMRKVAITSSILFSVTDFASIVLIYYLLEVECHMELITGQPRRPEFKEKRLSEAGLCLGPRP